MKRLIAVAAAVAVAAAAIAFTVPSGAATTTWSGDRGSAGSWKAKGSIDLYFAPSEQSALEHVEDGDGRIENDAHGGLPQSDEGGRQIDGRPR